MWEAIASNRKRSLLLIGLMGGILVLLGALIGWTIGPQFAAVGAVGALIVWLVMLLVTFIGGDQVLLMSVGAREIEHKDLPVLWNVVEEMRIASGAPNMPKVYIIEEKGLNAFAVGRNPDKAAIAVTSGLLQRLNRDELQGVIAHEMGHIRNHDVRFMTIASVMMGSIVILSDVFLRSLFYGGMGRRRSSRSGGGQGQAVIILIAVVVAVLAPILAHLLYFACSRRREYLADASAARFTRFPNGLAAALEKISARGAAMQNVNRAVLPLFIVNPKSMAAASAFATHPPTEKRIRILRSMGGSAGYVGYEAAFKKIDAGEGGLLGARTLTAAESVEARKPSPGADAKQAGVERLQGVGDLLARLANYALITCVCGVRIKVPPDSKAETIDCPRCGRPNAVAVATLATDAHDAGKQPGVETGRYATPLQYQRKGAGWETFKCSCDTNVQLSPSFSGNRMRCPSCQREIHIS